MEKKHAIAATIILVLLAGVGWALYSAEDKELAEAKQLRDEMLNNMDTLTDEQRRAQRDALREKTNNFSEAQRREFGQGFRQFMMQRVDKLLAMPPEEQKQELDKWIDRMEERRAGGGERGGRGEGRGGDRGGDMSPAERDQRRKQGLDRTTPEMRAKMDAMKDLINQRREERGLDPIQGPGGRGMFGGGRPGGGPPR